MCNRLFLVFLFCWLTCDSNIKAQNEPGDAGIEFSLFLIGDAGLPDTETTARVLKMLSFHLNQAGSDGGVVFLGDNIYPRGLPDIGHPEREISEKRLTEQLKVVQEFPGRVVFIPGNHDWNKGDANGWNRVKNQQEFVESFLRRDSVFLPFNGCPGPVAIELSSGLALVVVDTQWILHQNKKPGEEDGCLPGKEDDVYEQLEEALEGLKGKHLVVASHHPMFSAGEHAGHSTWIDHIFPLTNLHPALYIPLPIIGSAYPIYRKFAGHIQDLPHPKNTAMRSSLSTVFNDFPNLIHAAGHEHALQYFKHDEGHYIVSGSGSKLTPIKKNNDAEFAVAVPGFAIIRFYSNSQAWLEFWTTRSSEVDGEMIYRERLY